MSEFQPQERVTGHFDQAANVYYSWYDMPNSDGHSFRIRRTRCLELLKGLPQNAKIVDIGCGPATFVDDLLTADFDVLATDIAPHMIEDGRKRFAGRERIRFEVAPAHTIPVSNASVHAITAMGLVEYLNDEDAVYREAHRALRSQGTLIVTYPHYYSPTRAWNRLTHALVKPFLRILRKDKTPKGVKHREYHLDCAIRSIEQAGFAVTDIVFYNFKLGFRPLDQWFPKITVWISERLERYCRTPLIRRIGTGFIIKAIKKDS